MKSEFGLAEKYEFRRQRSKKDLTPILIYSYLLLPEINCLPYNFQCN